MNPEPRRRNALGMGLALLAAAVIAACGGGSSSGYAGGMGSPGTAPSFTSQPSPATVVVGSTASFSAQVSGDPAPSEQWEQSPDGNSWTAISGAMSSTYAFTPARSDNGRRFRARAANSNGNAVSGTAALTVMWAPAITTQPADQVVDAPSPATFTVAMDANPMASCQWQSSADGSIWTDIPGASTPSFSTGPTTMGMNELHYRCVCTNPVGSAVSSPATLRVDATGVTLTVSVGAGSTGSPGATASYPQGTVVPYSYSALSGYANLQVLLDGAAVPASGSLTMTVPHTLAVSASPVMRTVTFTAGTGGSVSGPSPQSVPNGGSTAAVTAVPAAGFTFANWTGTGFTTTAANPLLVAGVTQDLAITANFSPVAVRYTISASAGAWGAISPSGAVSVAAGGSQAFTITPDAGYTVADVLVDGASQGALTTYTFTNVSANHTISATFKAVYTGYTITATPGDYGSISPSGTVNVPPGGSQAFTITADPLYVIADVLVDGASVGKVSSYTFTNVTANHRISATFTYTGY